MRLYVEPMEAVVVEVSDEGRVRYASAGPPRLNEAGWSTPTQLITHDFTAQLRPASRNSTVPIAE
jgi:hypothetical protein